MYTIYWKVFPILEPCFPDILQEKFCPKMFILLLLKYSSTVNCMHNISYSSLMLYFTPNILAWVVVFN